MPNPPLAGRPPYATDEDDSVYLNTPTGARRRPAKPQQSQEREMSQYAAYDDYFQDQQRVSGHGGVGMGMMSGAMDDSDDEDDRRAAPRGKASPIQAPPPAARAEKPMQKPMQMPSQQQQQQRSPPNMQQQQGPPGGGYDQHPNTRQATRGPPQDLRVQIPIPQPISAPAPAFMAPPSPSPSMLTPHPLDHPTTPITPVFARPSMDASRGEVKFQEPILRGNSEDRLIPREGPQKDDFWRRFSMVAKDDARKAPKEKQSTFLKSYEAGNQRKKRVVWFIAIVLLLCIGGAVGLGWYFTHNKPSAQPKAIGGKSNETTHDTLPVTVKGGTSTKASAVDEPTSIVRSLGPVATLGTRRKRGETSRNYHNRKSWEATDW